LSGVSRQVGSFFVLFTLGKELVLVAIEPGSELGNNSSCLIQWVNEGSNGKGLGNLPFLMSRADTPIAKHEDFLLSTHQALGAFNFERFFT
jgi:hypothetical protein